MGHNIDLQWLLGLPEYVRCPHCKEMTKTWFDDYDIDADNPYTQNQWMHLNIQCAHCERDFEFVVRVVWTDINNQ